MNKALTGEARGASHEIRNSPLLKAVAIGAAAMQLAVGLAHATEAPKNFRKKLDTPTELIHRNNEIAKFKHRCAKVQGVFTRARGKEVINIRTTTKAGKPKVQHLHSILLRCTVHNSEQPTGPTQPVDQTPTNPDQPPKPPQHNDETLAQYLARNNAEMRQLVEDSTYLTLIRSKQDPNGAWHKGCSVLNQRGGGKAGSIDPIESANDFVLMNGHCRADIFWRSSANLGVLEAWQMPQAEEISSVESFDYALADKSGTTPIALLGRYSLMPKRDEGAAEVIPLPSNPAAYAKLSAVSANDISYDRQILPGTDCLAVGFPASNASRKTAMHVQYLKQIDQPRYGTSVSTPIELTSNSQLPNMASDVQTAGGSAGPAVCDTSLKPGISYSSGQNSPVETRILDGLTIHYSRNDAYANGDQPPQYSPENFNAINETYFNGSLSPDTKGVGGYNASSRDEVASLIRAWNNPATSLPLDFATGQ